MPPHSHISYWSSSLLSLLCLLHFKTDLHNFHNVSLQISICICPEFKIYVSEIQKSSSKGICQTLQSWWQRDWWGSLVFIKISQCNCPNFKMYLSKFQNVFAKHCNPNDKETGGARRPPLLALSPFANCWIFHELLCFALNQHLFIIDDGDDDFNDLKRFAPRRYPPKIYPPKLCLPKLNLAQLPALIKCTLSKYTLDNCALCLGLGDTSQNRWENPKYISAQIALRP